MENIICKKCGLVNDYRVEFRGGHKCAWCNGCGSFLKNIAHKEPQFYFGKYKGLLISECTDVWYMEWAIKSGVVKGNIRQAIYDRLEILGKEIGGEK